MTFEMIIWMHNFKSLFNIYLQYTSIQISIRFHEIYTDNTML